MLFFDAHLDLAYLAVNGRDVTAPLDPTVGPNPPAAVTLPSLAEGNVALALATIFTELDGTGPEGYPAGDAERAHRAGRAQLEAYLTWRDRGLLTFDLRKLLASDPGVGEIRGGIGVSELVIPPVRRLVSRVPAEPPLHIGILIENADPIRSPAELGWWKNRGVVAIGLSWAKSSRYAGGNNSQCGISPIGRELVHEMDRLGIVHDASHLSDRAFDDLCALTKRPIIASHSNCRSLLGDPDNQRHLRDDQIREIARRGGVIGLNLYSKFLLGTPPLRSGFSPSPSDPPRATLDQTLRHLDHICELTGSVAHIGLGSDMDGGLSADRLPVGINRPRDLHQLTDAMSTHGWSEEAVFGFACANWVSFFSTHTT